MYKITYQNGNTLLLATVLKCASSTALHAAYYPLLKMVEHGRNKILAQALTFDPLSMKVTDFPHRIAIIRNPVDRLFSVYVNHYLKKIENQKFRLSNPKIKTFLDFVINLEYIKSNLEDIYWHTMPIYLALDYHTTTDYTRILDSKNINTEFIPLIKEISGVDVPLIHANTTPKKEKKCNNIYKEKAVPLIKEIYKKDYEEYGKYFT